MLHNYKVIHTKQYKMMVFAILGMMLSFNTIAQVQEVELPAAATPSIFAQGVISTGLSERDFTISPKGDEIFYTIQSAKFVRSTIIRVRKVKGQWQLPEIAPFSGTYKDLEAAFSPDGNTLYFSSNRPVNTSDSTPDFDIWKVVKQGTAWSDPIHLGNVVNSPKDEFYPSITKSGNLYLTQVPEKGYGKEDIVLCAFVNGTYQSPIVLDSAINTKGYEFNAFVDPDETFMLFTSLQGRKDEMGGGDLYISKKDKLGNWQKAVNMGKDINSTGVDYCPFVSWDKKTLFFTSNRITLTDKPIPSWKQLRELLSNSGNGSEDIYRVAISDKLP